jgi:hypothetical protein
MTIQEETPSFGKCERAPKTALPKIFVWVWDLIILLARHFHPIFFWGWEYRRENKKEDRSNAPVLVEMEPAEVLSVIA